MRVKTMWVENSQRAVAVALLGWVVACVGESTPLATQNDGNGGSGEETGTDGWVVELDSCGSFESGTGSQLVDPARECFTSYQDCRSGHIFQLRCDGLGCLCFTDGWPQAGPEIGAIRTPRCPIAREAAELCDWPDSVGSFAQGTEPIQGLPCEDATDAKDCECVDGHLMCPGANGCTVVGDFGLGGAVGRALHFRSNGTFYVADSADVTYEEVADENAAGFHGTWTLTDALLSMRSEHSSYSPTCELEPGRYEVTFDDECQLTALTAIDEPCSEREVLETSLTPL